MPYRAAESGVLMSESLQLKIAALRERAVVIVGDDDAVLLQLIDSIAEDNDLRQALEIYQQFNKAQQAHFSKQNRVRELLLNVDYFDDETIYLYDAETGDFVEVGESDTGDFDDDANWQTWACSVADEKGRVLIALDGMGQMLGTTADQEFRDAIYEDSDFHWVVDAAIVHGKGFSTEKRNIWISDYPEERVNDMTIKLVETTWGGTLPINVSILSKERVYHGESIPVVNPDDKIIDWIDQNRNLIEKVWPGEPPNDADELGQILHVLTIRHSALTDHIAEQVDWNNIGEKYWHEWGYDEFE
jgi:hypothetical protein